MGLYLASCTYATQCFPRDETEMPFVLGKDDGTGQPGLNDSSYQSIVGNDNYIIAAGTSYESSLNALGDT